MKMTSSLVRLFRKYHKWFGLSLMVFLLISAITGLLLGWKKQADILQPTEIKHGAKDLTAYVSLAEMEALGNRYWKERYPEQNNFVKRIDIKVDKGIVKLLFAEGYWEAQIHPESGELLSLKQRHSDWIEALHDGSLISDNFKLIMMTLLGFGLSALSISGFYLWYGPSQLRNQKKTKVSS